MRERRELMFTDTNQYFKNQSMAMCHRIMADKKLNTGTAHYGRYGKFKKTENDHRLVQGVRKTGDTRLRLARLVSDGQSRRHPDFNSRAYYAPAVHYLHHDHMDRR